MKYYVVTNGLKEGIFKDKEKAILYTKNYGRREIKSFSNYDDAVVFYKQNKKSKKEQKQSNENFYTLVVNEKGYSINELNEDLKINKKLIDENTSITIFENKKQILDYISKEEVVYKVDKNKKNKINKNQLFSIFFEYSEQSNQFKKISNDERLTVYVDGSYNKTKNKYSSGLIFLQGEEVIKEVMLIGNNKEILPYQNVAGEIIAAIYAMNTAYTNNIKEMDLYFDFEGIESFCKNSCAYMYISFLYNRFYNEIREKVKINFHKVKAHSGNVLNNRADKLSKKAFV